MNKLKLSNTLYKNGSETLECFVYNFNSEKHKIDIFIPKYNMNVRQKLLHNKTKELFNIQYNKHNIIISNDVTTTKTKIPLFTKIKIQLTGKPNIFNIDDSLQIANKLDIIDNVWVIGGSNIYEQCLRHPKLDKIYLTNSNREGYND